MELEVYIISKPKALLFALTISLGALTISSCGMQPGGEDTQGTVLLANADFPHYESAAEMYSRATTVVVGEVTGSKVAILDLAMKVDGNDESVNSQAGEIVGEAVPAEEIFTIYSLKVHDFIKRDARFESDLPLEVKMYGAEVDGVTYKLEGAPDLGSVNGKLLILFLEEYGDGMPASPLNNDQAILVVDSDYSEVQSLASDELSEIFKKDVLDLIASE